MPERNIFNFIAVRAAELNTNKDHFNLDYITDERISRDGSSISINKPYSILHFLEDLYKKINDGLPEFPSYEEVKKSNKDEIWYLEGHWDTLVAKNHVDSSQKERSFLDKLRKILEQHTDDLRPHKLYRDLEKEYHAYLKSIAGNENTTDFPSLMTLLVYPSEEHSISELYWRQFNLLYIHYILKRFDSINLEDYIRNLQTLHTLRLFVASYCYKANRWKGWLKSIWDFFSKWGKWLLQIWAILRRVIGGDSGLKLNPSAIRIVPGEQELEQQSILISDGFLGPDNQGSEPEDESKSESQEAKEDNTRSPLSLARRASSQARRTIDKIRKQLDKEEAEDEEGEPNDNNEVIEKKTYTAMERRSRIAGYQYIQTSPIFEVTPAGILGGFVDSFGDLICQSLPFSVETGSDLQRLLNAQPIIPPQFAYLFFYRHPFNPIKPIGIGDLKVVKQELIEYAAGEVAHIENVLMGEFKERSHRRLNRVEDTFLFETETIEVEENELQTTDQFELQKEAESVIQTDMSVQAGVTVTGGYGPVEITAYGDFAYSRSKQDSQRSASNFSKEVVDRSLKRIQTRVREQRTQKRINEIEEINKHGIDNKSRNRHISGIYRFVDKNYKSQIYNYGKRLMFEFVVPEPGEFYSTAQRNNQKVKLTPPIEEPTQPDFPGIRIGTLDQEVVDDWSAKYNLNNIKQMPATEKIVNDALAHESPDPDKPFSFSKPYIIEDGYVATKVRIHGSWAPILDKGTAFHIAFGNARWFYEGDVPDNDTWDVNQLPWTEDNDGGQKTHANAWLGEQEQLLSNFSKQVFLSITVEDVNSYIVNLEITLTLTPEARREWQIDTYNKIMDAYQEKFQQYLSDLAAYEAVKQSREAQESQIQIVGRNSRISQEIIKEELKKQCITIITKQFDSIEAGEEDFDAMNVRNVSMITGRNEAGDETTNDIYIPTLEIDETMKEGRLIQFFEQAFDWENITYLLYPYFWGRMKKWYEQYHHLDETDYLFGAFLRSGAARVLIAVKPHYETAIMHYLYTGEVWNGGPAPVIGDDLYIPIHEELRNQQDDLHGGEPEGDPWEYVVPTPLVYLQEGSELPVFTS